MKRCLLPDMHRQKIIIITVNKMIIITVNNVFYYSTQIEKIKTVHEKKKIGRDEVMKELQEIRKEVSEVEKEKEEILKRKREIEKQLRSGEVGGVTTPICFLYYILFLPQV